MKQSIIVLVIYTVTIFMMQIHFYAIMKKNRWIIVQSTLNLLYTKGMLMIFFFFFHLQLFADYLSKQHKWLKFTSEAENDKSVSFLDIL